MSGTPVDAILASVRRLLHAESRLVLAVSGGKDSMTLLDAVARARTADHTIVVATMDHRTGVHARAAAALVVEEARARGLQVLVGRARPRVPRTEAALRDVRWAFLRSVAARECATIVTAHTRDDQIETIVMRLLRGAGTRGLAGLAAPSDVRRPLLGHARAAVEQYVRGCGLVWIDDPTNQSRVFFRNRLRLDLLPAIRRVQPNLENELIALSAGAARIREALDEVARGLIRTGAPPPGRAPAVDAATLEALDDASLRVLWPAIAARMGVVLDRRGTERLARFTPRARIGARMQLSGGFEVLRERSVFTLRPCEIPAPAVGDVPLRDALRFGRFRFEVVRGASTDPGPADPAARPADPWVASFPDSHEFKVTVRAWRPGDRIDAPGSRLAGAAQDRRRVKRLFADARIAGPLREGWPVVLLNERIVWVPGVRRAPDATVRAGGASIVYRCHAD